jgi:AbrB family looped-hinge helix DNA binding protein
MKVFATAEITTNNRITVPKKVLDILHLTEGDIILFFNTDGVITLRSSAE